MIIKVCGLCHPANIREVAALGIDWAGFIFWHKSKRQLLIDNGQWTILNSQFSILNSQLKKVGVFVNAPIGEMAGKAAAYRLDYLQLHGGEPPSLCRDLQEQGFALIKAFPIATAADLEQTSAYEGLADYFLFDTRCEGYGGSGRSFNWELLQAYNGATPFLLSGGINPNSAGAIRRFRHPRFAGIDLNSGFETAPGQKDPALLREFISLLRTMDGKS